MKPISDEEILEYRKKMRNRVVASVKLYKEVMKQYERCNEKEATHSNTWSC